MATEESEAETERAPPNEAEQTYLLITYHLDALDSYAERALVVLNLVKYIAIVQAAEAERPDRVFEHLCLDFALKIAGLPDSVVNNFIRECAGCPECKPGGIN